MTRSGRLLAERYGALIDRIEFSIPVNNPEDGERLTSMLTELQATSRR